MPKKKSLYQEHPDYRVDLEPSDAHVCLRLGDEVIAESTKTLLVRETRLEPVVYFPKADVRFDRLEKTAHETFCPFKGDASYWTVRAGGLVEENAVWGYEDPFEEVAGLKDYVSFYSYRFSSSGGESAE